MTSKIIPNGHKIKSICHYCRFGNLKASVNWINVFKIEGSYVLIVYACLFACEITR